MSVLTEKEIDELRALQHMADKGMAAWTNEDFQDLLAAYDKSAEIRAAQSNQISKLGKTVADLQVTVDSMDDVEKSHRADCHGLSQRIEELEMLLDAAGADGK